MNKSLLLTLLIVALVLNSCSTKRTAIYYSTTHDKYDANNINASASNADYDYWCTGNCDEPYTPPSTHPGIILMGGSVDVDAAVVQHIAWSNCGDFLVLRASGSNGYNSYIYNMGCSNSVSTILIHNSMGANEQFVVDKIDQASAIFFAGGDQGKYIRDWKGTLLQQAVQNAINRDVPIGGTSAGCMIQSWYIYTADNGTVHSDEALENPYNRYMTFSDAFVRQKVDLLYNTIIDTHFEQRNRFGRLFGFVARMRKDHGPAANVKGIGINEQTALVIDLKTNVAVTMGPLNYGSAAFIIMPGALNNPAVCEPNMPLTYKDVYVQKLEAYFSDTFNFETWTGGVSSELYQISANNGRLDNRDPYDPPDGVVRGNKTQS